MSFKDMHIPVIITECVFTPSVGEVWREYVLEMIDATGYKGHGFFSTK